MNFLCNEDKGIDQLRVYQAADLRFWFHMYAENRFRHDKAHMSLVVRKPVFGVSDLVGHKPGCAVLEDG